MTLLEPITEEWLREVGFRWYQFDLQPDKQWLLWLGTALAEPGGWNFTSYDELGIELAPNRDGTWFYWLRSNSAGRYHRFIHVRHLRVRGDVIQLIVALTGLSWTPANHLNGCVYRQAHADSIRRNRERLDQRLLQSGGLWREAEKDESRGRALPEHMDAAIKNGDAQ
jgi:hypothetical protein